MKDTAGTYIALSTDIKASTGEWTIQQQQRNYSTVNGQTRKTPAVHSL